MLKKFLLIMLLFAGSLAAQTANGTLMLGIPQGEFGDNVDRVGFGLQLQGTIWSPTPKVPVSLGLNVGFLVYGSESDRRPLSTTIPDVMVDVDRSNNLVNFHLVGLVSPFAGDVRPYLEGLIGGSYIFTSTSVESQYDDEDVFSSTNFDDWAWSYGGGGGILIKLKDNIGNGTKLFLDLKARYLLGSKAEYLKEGDVDINPRTGEVFYYISESKTDLLTLHIGVMAFFNTVKF